jgi:hypothetical protein
LHTADFDYFYAHTSGGVSRFPGNPDGTFGEEEVIHDAWYNSYNIYHTDFDNDGDERNLFAGNVGEFLLRFC